MRILNVAVAFVRILFVDRSFYGTRIFFTDGTHFAGSTCAGCTTFADWKFAVAFVRILDYARFNKLHVCFAELDLYACTCILRYHYHLVRKYHPLVLLSSSMRTILV